MAVNLVSNASAAAMARSMMKSGDANGDSKLSQAEFTSALKQAPGSVKVGATAVGAAATFKAMDTDADGSLNASELQQGVQSLASNTASILLQVQEQQNPLKSLTASNASALYGNLLSSSSDTSSLVLAAYAAKLA